jgi:hypothetical protein
MMAPKDLRDMFGMYSCYESSLKMLSRSHVVDITRRNTLRKPPGHPFLPSVNYLYPDTPAQTVLQRLPVLSDLDLDVRRTR